MRVELINNSGVHNLKQQLEEQVKNCNNFSIATAFITLEGINILQAFLSKNKNRLANGRLIISLYQSFNSKKTLKALKTLDATSKGRILIHISQNPSFHWKYYYFEEKRNVIAFIGSANFTSSGIEGIGELVSKITLNKSDKSLYTNLNKTFDVEFENSIPISKFPVDLYKSSLRDIRQVYEKLHPEIRKLLNKKKIKKEGYLPQFLILIKGYLSKATEKMITKTKSHWDKNNWDYFVCESKREFDKYTKCRYMVIVNFFNRKYTFSINEIKDFTPLKTPDGSYFIAHKAVTKVKRETNTLNQQLLDLGIQYRSRGFNDFKLSKKKIEEIKELLS